MHAPIDGAIGGNKLIKNIFKKVAIALLVATFVAGGMLTSPISTYAANNPQIEIPGQGLLMSNRAPAQNMSFTTLGSWTGNSIRVWYRNDSNVWTTVRVIASNGAQIGQFSVAPGAGVSPTIRLYGEFNRTLRLQITTTNGTQPRGEVAVRQILQ